ncbi:MAG: hypothetical protein KDC70_18950, partial [Saprospiraceae bacterium]|nr:hypothetical protein [Saprospiraceae bacterium]
FVLSLQGSLSRQTSFVLSQQGSLSRQMPFVLSQQGSLSGQTSFVQRVPFDAQRRDRAHFRLK